MVDKWTKGGYKGDILKPSHLTDVLHDTSQDVERAWCKEVHSDDDRLV